MHPGVITQDQKASHIAALASKSRDKFELEKKKEARRNAWPWPRKFLYAVVHSHRFEGVCGAIILFNMGIVVVETDTGVDDSGAKPFWAEVAATMLLVIYTVELVSKLYVYRKDFFKEMWNVLDFAIVGTDLVFVVVALIVDEMPSVSILRVFRLVRLARAFKAAKSFKELNALLRACTCALKAIFWGMVMVFMSLTVWGILAVQLIHPINKKIADHKPYLYEGCERCPRSYATVFASMLTFWKQLVAGDSWGTLCEPIIEEEPWTAAFFMMVLVTVNLTMLNCILAVVVEAGAAAAAADEHDKAMERQKVVFEAEGKLIDFCQGLDSDSSGSLSIEEFLRGFHHNKAFRECLELMHVTQTDMYMIFNICDEDDSGDVDYREFVEQLRRIKHSGDQLLLHYVTDIRHQVNKIRPECLKAPGKFKALDGADPVSPVLEEGQKEEKRDEGQEKLSGDIFDKGFEAPAASSDEDLFLPDALEELLIKDEKLQAKAQEEASMSMDDILRRDKLEKIVERINTDLTAIMNDLVVQSKAQTQLLNQLVDGFQSNSASQEESPLANAAQILDGDPDVVRLQTRSSGSLTRLASLPDPPPAISARGDNSSSACGCVRIV